ncbi:phage tail protein [Novosphingopyxis sp.]|uniref:phage tail protein n=1 Tax=Novosphingopyxis sp. TaxID=2709690 RepID=UPI003B5B38FA
MATIVLNAVGFALGGPIGGALGSLAGRALDAQIFGGPKSREGPRLKELDIQTSSYGSEIPALFGAMRVAGTVIWATDLIEHEDEEGGGKGRPSQTSYSYSASLAVALSSRPATRIGRIWADGNLLRGEAGDFKVETGFRFHSGYGDQPADPLIAQAEGDEAPGFRGLAYAVFENLQLADYGNRIPSLGFELFERGGSVRLVEIAGEASGGRVRGDDPATVRGFAASGTARDVVQLIVEGTGLRLARGGEGFLLNGQPPRGGAISDPVVTLGAEALDRPERSRAPLGDYPTAIEYRHYDIARDYQAGLQRARRAGVGCGVARLDFPAAMTADEAMVLAVSLARRAGAERERLRLAVAHGADDLRAGSTLDWDGARWTISEIEHRRGAMLVTARSLARTTPIAAGGLSGRALREADRAHGPTRLMLVELPDIARGGGDRPVVAAAAAGLSPGWRRAALSIGNGGDSLRPIGVTAPAAVMGVLEYPLAATPPGLVDARSRPVVRLLNPEMTLRDADRAALLTGANIAAIGGEVLQFERAVALGETLYRLERLYRGLYGTEAHGDHAAGGTFLLLQRDRLRLLEGPEIAAGLPLSAAALGIADERAVMASVAITGRAALPFAPVHFTAEPLPGGALRLRWVRRSRLGAEWSLSVEPPLGEDTELYRLSATDDAGTPLAQWETASPQCVAVGTMLGDWREGGVDRLHFAVRQVGRGGLSPAAHIAVSLN